MGVEPTTFCLGSKHSTTELRPLCLFDDKSPRFPCQLHWVRTLRFGGHQVLLLKHRAGQPPKGAKLKPAANGERAIMR